MTHGNSKLDPEGTVIFCLTTTSNYATLISSGLWSHLDKEPFEFVGGGASREHWRQWSTVFLKVPEQVGGL